MPLLELNIFLEIYRTEFGKVTDVEMHLFHTFSNGLPALQHVPEVRHLGTFLRQFVLVPDALDGGFQHLAVTEREINDRFQRAECSQRDNPVAENTVVDGFAFHSGGQFALGDGEHVRKVLFE